MSLDANLASWLTLSQIPGLGNESFRRLLQTFGSPESIIAAPAASLRQIVKPGIADAIARDVDVKVFAPVSLWLEDAANHIVTLADKHYPQMLLNIPDPPLLLYVKGRLDLLNHASIAVVGSRNATTQGIRNAESFSLSISEADLCIISGMAHGIDAAAHQGGLRGRGASIGIVGTGLDKVYPSANRELAQCCSLNDFW